MKNTLFSTQSILTTLKALVVNLVAFLCVMLLPMLLAFWLKKQDLLFVGVGVQVLAFIVYLWVWGYFANKFWKWN